MTYLILTCFLFAFWGCEMPPLWVYFRNYSANTVKLSVTLIRKEDYPRLPNRVIFYDTASKRKNMCGERRYEQFVTWTDPLNFEIDIPPYTVIDVNDIAAGNRKIFNELLIASTPFKTDTLLSGIYFPISEKFHFRGGFSKYKFYYDFN